MSIDTPRTHQEYWYDGDAECDVVSAEFAEQLERELAAALMMCEQNRVLAATNQVVADNHLDMYRREHEAFLDMRYMYQNRIADLNYTITELRERLACWETPNDQSH